MPAAKRRLLIESNGSRRKTFIWKDKSGRVINLTGYTAKLMVKRAVEDAAPLIELSTENGGIIITPNRGRIELVFTPAQIAAAVSGGVYDLVMQPAGNGDPVRLLEGQFAVSLGVTSP